MDAAVKPLKEELLAYELPLTEACRRIMALEARIRRQETMIRAQKEELEDPMSVTDERRFYTRILRVADADGRAQEEHVILDRAEETGMRLVWERRAYNDPGHKSYRFNGEPYPNAEAMIAAYKRSIGEEHR